jgi:hybrid cluster-associated redox disulfide protein
MVPKIHKEMIVGEVVGMFPEAADIITSYGLHCVGCHANAYETLEQGLLGHGYTEENLNSLVDELNEYLEEMVGEGGVQKSLPPEAEKMEINATDFAIEKILEIAEIQEKKKVIIRIEAKKIATAMKYSMNFIEENEIGPDEKIFKFSKGKIQIVANKWDYQKIDGLKIDYVVEEDREGFKMKNPNTEAGS